jgi:copper chaperone
MTTLSIPDMSCGHCKAAVEAALSAVPGALDIRVDLARRQVSVAGDAAPAALITALDAAGYPATPVG